MRRCERKSVEVAVFRRGWVTFGEYLTGKRASPINHCWCQKTRVIAVSCGIILSAVHHLVLNTIHASNRQTDGQTESRQQYRALHYMQSHGKNGVLDQYGPLNSSNSSKLEQLALKGLRASPTLTLKTETLKTLADGWNTVPGLWRSVYMQRGRNTSTL